jgi:hypothetical protein
MKSLTTTTALVCTLPPGAFVELTLARAVPPVAQAIGGCRPPPKQFASAADHYKFLLDHSARDAGRQHMA